MENINHLLREIYLFKEFSEAMLSKLSKIAVRKVLNQADQVFSEGAAAGSMFIVEYGSLQVAAKGKEDDQNLTMIGTGMHFGELPFLDGMPRSASVAALEKTGLIEIRYDDLKKLFAEDTAMAALFYREIAHFLAARLRKMTTDLTFARERNLKHF